ncbi:MAG: hypothetical protein R2751_17365 [Bacteroidales bacterium]
MSERLVFAPRPGDRSIQVSRLRPFCDFREPVNLSLRDQVIPMPQPCPPALSGQRDQPPHPRAGPEATLLSSLLLTGELWVTSSPGDFSGTKPA